MPLDFSKMLKHVSKVKLRGGVVGKVSMVLIVLCGTIGGLAAVSKNDWVIGGSIVAIILVVFRILCRLIDFAKAHPQAALMEGAEFLVHEQLTIAQKGSPETPVI